MSKFDEYTDREYRNCRDTILAIAIPVMLILFALLVSCKCPCAAIPSGGATHQENDSTRTEYVHDSIHIHHWHKEIQKGDTFYIHDSIDRYKDRFVYIHDSIDNSRTDTICKTIEVASKTSKFLRNSGVALWIIIAVAVVIVIVGLTIKIAK